MKNCPKIISIRGSALLLVLGCVALLTIMVLAFLVTTATERSSANFYSRGVSTSLLSEQVLNLVTAQIHQGTLSLDSNPNAPGYPNAVVAWVSQPGMLRTYNTTGASSYYKLFSSDAMVGTGTYNSTTDTKDIPPSDWSGLSSVYTDLNSPINNVYPIVDNNHLSGGYTDPVSGQGNLLTYTFTNPAGTFPSVEGFTVNPNTTFSTKANPVAMPVQWIYVLQDGTLIPPTWTDGVDKVTIPSASSSNPIIGRIAFWTDDETSKVNINTASEGSFWDVPLADGPTERNLAYNIPVKGEYNRVPGHPATVSLSSLFKDIYTPANANSLIFNPVYYLADLNPVQNLLGLTPRTLFGGSKFGTQPILLNQETPTMPAYSALASTFTGTLPPPAAPAPVDNKDDRLYSSVDELLYSTTAPSPQRNSNPPSATSQSYVITPEVVQRSRFFATAKSRAPEVTLFNTPRVSMWPITWPWSVKGSIPVTYGVNSIKQNPYFTATTTPGMLVSSEKLLAYCGTVGGWPYYFQRQDAYSTGNDWNNITRNQDLFSYLQNLTGNPIPGYGGNFLTKYGDDRDQILTEMFDYIRSGPNLNNNTTNAANAVIPNYYFAPSGNRGVGNWGGMVNGSVIPIVIPDKGTKGAGRFSTIKGAALIFYAADRRKGDGTNAGPDVTTTEPLTTTGTINMIQRYFINYPGAYVTPGNAILAAQNFGMQTTKLGMYLVFDQTNTSPGYIEDTAGFIIKIIPPNGQSNFGPFTIGPSSSSSTTQVQTLNLLDNVNFSNNSLLWCANVITGGWVGNYVNENWMAATGIPRAIATQVAKSFSHGSYNPSRYPFFADPVTVDPNDLTFQFTGSDVAIQIWSIDPNSGNNATPKDLIQTIQLPLSQLSGIYPMPCAPAFTSSSGGVWRPWTAAKPYTTATPTENDPGPPLSHPQNLDLSTSTPPQAAPGLSGTIVTALSHVNGGSGNAVPTTEINGATTTVNGVATKIHYYFSLTNTAPGADPISGATYASVVDAYGNRSFGDMRNIQLRAANTISSGNIWNSGSTGWGYTCALISEPVDTAFSMVLDPQYGTGGDLRVLALTSNVPGSALSTSGWFIPHYGIAAMLNASQPAGLDGREAISLGGGDNYSCGYLKYEEKFGVGTFNNTGLTPEAWSGQNTKAMGLPSEPVPAKATMGDFANGSGGFPDGATIPKPDDSNWTMGIDGDGSIQIPYFGGYNGELSGSQPYFSPARQISGPIAFGVLPTGVKATYIDIVNHPHMLSTNSWRTLVFNPNPAISNLQVTSNTAAHLGLNSPPDYLLLDDFWMPVVEPYAISEPLSTAGKINMNYQIVPFSHITRRTGLYAAMKSDVITAIPYNAASPDATSYKNKSTGSVVNNWSFRYPIDVPHTLELLDYQSTTNGRLFISPAEICSIYLVPQQDQVDKPYLGPGINLPSMSGNPGSDLSRMQQWWQAFNPRSSTAATGANTALTGANGRQQPYAHLYSLLTTKSNTFQVHMRVQLLKKAVSFKGNDPTIYDESTGDRVVGEYRGSAIIERYVDPSDPSLAGIDFATGSNAFSTPGIHTLDPYYKYRVTSVNAFTP